MKIKTSELTRAALNWAVSKCEGHIRPDGGLYEGHQGRVFHPSTNWAHGGPIIEREEISVNWANGQWQAHTANDQDEYTQIEYGPTPLIAAMRCYVASKMGDEIDVPEQLL